MWECGGIFILHEEVDYMLTPKQNMLEVIKGGNPDRFVNQYEGLQSLVPQPRQLHGITLHNRPTHDICGKTPRTGKLSI